MLIGLVNNRTNKRKSLKNPYDKNKQKKKAVPAATTSRQ
jgi:hypothetical protein